MVNEDRIAILEESMEIQSASLSEEVLASADTFECVSTDDEIPANQYMMLAEDKPAQTFPNRTRRFLRFYQRNRDKHGF